MEIIARGQITIWNYKDGDDAYSVILNHDTHAVACDPSGNALGGELGSSGKAVFVLSAYKGATKLTMRYSSAASTAGMCAWKFGTISGCTAAQMSGSNEKFYINTMTADSAYVEVVCSVDGKASITKRVTIVKQKKGDTGEPGEPGDDGKQGCMLRPRGTWTAQTQYVYNDQYRDVVLYNNSVYIVKATHTSAVSFESSKWEPFNEFINVATSVLLANKGYIDVLGAARLFVGDTNKSTGWEMTNGYIKHTKSGLTLTADGKLYDPDGLHLSVGGKTVQAIVDGAVDGIQVGGRNYIQNSTFMYDFDKWVKFNYNGNYSISSQNGQYSLLISRLGYAGSNRHGISQTISTNLKPGEYTLSLKYRSDQFDGTRNQIFVRIYSTASAYADKGIITIPNTQGGDSDGQITFNVDSNVYKAELYVVLDKNGYLRVWDIKLEQGNKATDWSPAIEDVESSISDAQKAAEEAQQELETIASDNYITPSEKTALKQQFADMQSERLEIISNANRYGVSTTAYSTAYTAAYNALTKYTATTPQNIQVGADYADISAYYNARKTILNTIASAAKKAVDDLDTDLQGYKVETSSKIEQLPDQISLTVKKEVTSGGLNYITNTQDSVEIAGKGYSNQVVINNWKINKSISGKKCGAAFKIKFEGCVFTSSSSVCMQTRDVGGWYYSGLTATTIVSENKEYVIYRNTNTAQTVSEDGEIQIRIDYVSGGKITISEIRAYDVPEGGLSEPLPWYPSKWDTKVLSSEIKQTADSISLKVAGWQGGTNLLPRSKFSESVKGWNVNGSPAYGITTAKNEKCLYLSGTTSGSGIWQGGYMPIQYKVKGYLLSVSFDIYNPSNAKTLRIGLEGANSSEYSVSILNKGVSGWTRVAKVMTYENVNTDSFIIYTDYDNYPTVYVKNVKIEFGPYATNFTENEKDVLLSTGIDIFNKKLVLTADNTLIQSNDGTQIAMFTVKNGKPLLSAENIDAENLAVKRLHASNEAKATNFDINGDSATVVMSQSSPQALSSQLKIDMEKEEPGAGVDLRQYPSINLKGFCAGTALANVSEHDINIHGARFSKYQYTTPEIKNVCHCGPDYIAIGKYGFSGIQNYIRISTDSIKLKSNSISSIARTEAVDIGGIKLFFIQGLYVGQGQDWDDVNNEFLTDDPFTNKDII